MRKPKKPARYLPNITSHSDVTVAKLIAVSVKGRRVQRFIIRPEEYPKLKVRLPSLRKMGQASRNDFNFLDEASGEFYVVRRKHHNSTLPVMKTKIPFSTNFRISRIGCVHLEQTPSIMQWRYGEHHIQQNK